MKLLACLSGIMALVTLWATFACPFFILKLVFLAECFLCFFITYHIWKGGN